MLDLLRNNLRKIISVLIGVVVVALVILLLVNVFKGSAPFKPTQKATVENRTFKVKVAQDPKDKEIGLSQTKSMPNDYGMLFPFSEDGYYSFWMRNMKMPIDIIFINDGKVVKVFPNVQAPKDSNAPLEIYVPEFPADAVLEIKAGLSEKYKIKEGSQVSLSKI